MKLSPVARRFILHWGEMGTRWGVNRTVAQVHALLYISPNPLTAEEIAETLSVARSNVSTSLRELQSWRIVKAVHLIGDRRTHFESMADVWEMFRVILEERKRREADPTLAVLRECVVDLEKSGPSDAHARKRLGEMLSFFETLSGLHDEMRMLPIAALRGMVKARDRFRRLFAGPVRNKEE